MIIHDGDHVLEHNETMN